jgi:hypothetical protein
LAVAEAEKCEADCSFGLPGLYEQAVDGLWTNENPLKSQSHRIRILFNKDLFIGMDDDKTGDRKVMKVLAGETVFPPPSG